MSEAPAPQPISRLATAAALVALIALALPTIGILGIHLGALAPMTGFYLFGAGALLGGLIALALGALGLFTTRGGSDPEGHRRAWIGAVGGAVLLGGVGLAGSSGAELPPINDISTNLDDPPAFASDPAARGRDMAYPTDWKPLVAAAYPDLQPLRSTDSPERAFARALAASEALGWEVTRQNPAEGALEASDRTAVFQFVDDVVIRVRPNGDAVLIDVRSKSRDGQGDLGANANRIRAFLAAY